MENLISKLKKGTQIFIKEKEYIVNTKTWYSIEEDNSVVYIKCELTDNKVLVIIPEDNLIYFGEVVEEMDYKRLSEEQLLYKDIIFNKTGEGHQFITKIEFGDKEEVEGKCIFEDYEAGNNIISLGILTDRGNKKADVFSTIIAIEDIVIK